MDVHPEVADAFLNNSVYSPRYQTLLVNALEEMKGVGNRATFVRLAASSGNKDIAFFRERQAEMYTGFHKRLLRLKRLRAGRICRRANDQKRRGFQRAARPPRLDPRHGEIVDRRGRARHSNDPSRHQTIMDHWNNEPASKKGDRS